MPDSSNLPKRPSDPALFWISLFLTLSIILPLMACLVMYSGWQGQSQAMETQKAQSGVPIAGPGPAEDLTILVTIAREKPGFALLRFDAPRAFLQISAIPGESVLRSPNGPVMLEESYRAAGPGRAAALLEETLGLTIDRYLAITPQSIARIWSALEPPRVNLSSLLSSQELGALGLKDDPVITLRPEEAGDFIDQLDPGPARRARLQGAVWDAALRQRLDELPTVLIKGLRAESGNLLGNVTAEDLFHLEKSLDWLAKQETQVEASPIPGRYDRRTGRYEFDSESVSFAKERFGKPAEAQGPVQEPQWEMVETAEDEEAVEELPEELEEPEEEPEALPSPSPSPRAG